MLSVLRSSEICFSFNSFIFRERRSVACEHLSEPYLAKWKIIPDDILKKRIYRDRDRYSSTKKFAACAIRDLFQRRLAPRTMNERTDERTVIQLDNRDHRA